MSLMSLDPNLAFNEPDAIAWWKKCSSARGALLRGQLEHGVTWRELSPWIEVLHRHREMAKRLYVMWPMRFRVVL